jgi:putative ABC transport system permease protein
MTTRLLVRMTTFQDTSRGRQAHILRAVDVISDFRIAVRGLSRSKGFAFSAAVTLALGIAATTTIFSVVYGVLLRPLPYANADRLVVIQAEKAYSAGPRILNFSAPEFEPFASATTAFSSLASSGTASLTYRSDHGVEPIFAATVSGEYFSTLGTHPILGRAIGDESEPVIVISERLWRRLFAADPNIAGRSIKLTGSDDIERIYTIVGVMPPEFQLPFARTDAWRTLAFARSVGDGRVRERTPGGHEIVARLRDGVSLERARADAAAAVEIALKPHFTPFRLDIHPRLTLLGEHVRGRIGPLLWMLMGAVTLVLLLACANVANLILARQASRSREISMRLALGAPRGRLLAYLMTEGIVIAFIGTLAGIALAIGAVTVLQSMQPAQLTRLDAIAVDLPVVLFAAAAATLSVIVAGFIPAIVATRTDAALALRLGTRGTTPRLSRWLRSGLVVGQIAAAIVLIVGASLLARSVIALLRTDLGVSTENVLAVNLDLSSGPGVAMDDARRSQIAKDLEDRLAAMPSVRVVGLGSGVPPTGEYMRVNFDLSNRGITVSHMVTTVPASPGYFPALQIRLLAGRLFDDGDSATSSPVVVVNREAARRFFGDDNPIGRTLPITRQQMTIVGVVENVKYTGIAAGAEGVIYRPFVQSPMRVAVLFARTTGDPGTIAADVRRIINSYDSGIGIPRMQTLDAWVSDAMAQPRFRAMLLSTIAGIALVLAMVGLYSVIAYSVSQRTSEIGVRIAIGAQRADVIRLVLGEGARLATAGVVIGLASAYWASRLLATFLYGVTPTDLHAFAGSAIALLLVALLATYLPARRAARVDPMIALRAE